MKKSNSILFTVILVLLGTLQKLDAQAPVYSSKQPDSLVTMEVYLPFHKEKKRVTVAAYGEYAVLEGDIVLGKIAELRQQKAPVEERGVVCDVCPFWQNAIMPYQIEPGQFSAEYVNIIHQAAEYINSNTNLCLMQRTNETDYVSIIAADGCWSAIGRIGGAQHMSLNGCSFGTIVHEFSHAAGLWHEQSREDRDQHVYIFWDNIDPAQVGNFYQHIQDGQDRGAYDFYSIMHYGPFAFSSNGKPTIARKDCSTQPAFSLGGGEQYTPGDIEAVNYLFPIPCECSGGNCMADIGQVDRVALGNYARFVSREMKGNYKTVERLYIRHKAEIDKVLDTNDRAFKPVQEAWNAMKRQGSGTFLKAFLSKEDNVVTDKNVAVLRHSLLELGKAVRSDELKQGISDISKLLSVTAGKDLKSALIAFDRARLEELQTASTTTFQSNGNGQFLLRNNPAPAGSQAVLQYNLPAGGRMTTRLFDLQGRPVCLVWYGMVEAGKGEVSIDTGGVLPGVYFVQTIIKPENGLIENTQRLVVIRG